MIVKKIYISFLAIVLLPLCESIWSQVNGVINFWISPTQFDLSLFQGDQSTQSFIVRNLGKTNLRLRVYAADWLLTRAGDNKYFEAGKLSRSCATWLTINPVEFEIPPDSTQLVRFTLNVPDNVSGEYWCIIFFESIPIPSKWSPMVKVAGRLGSYIFVTIPNTEKRQGDIITLDVKEGSSYEITATFKNSGNVHLRLNCEIKIKDSLDAIIWSKQINNVFVLPNSERTIGAIADKELEAGKYSAIITIDYGADEILEGVRNFVYYCK